MNNCTLSIRRIQKQNCNQKVVKTQYIDVQEQRKFKNNHKIIRQQTKPQQTLKKVQIFSTKQIHMRRWLSPQIQVINPQNNQKLINDIIIRQQNQKIKIKTQLVQEQLIGELRYKIQHIIGSGTFGKVYKVIDKKTSKILALKKVFQNEKFRNRQLSILKMIHHENILKMHDWFITFEDDKKYLNIIMDYFSTNLKRFIIDYAHSQIPKILVQVLAYQLFRGLLYLQNQKIVHRDIKPHNILINLKTWKLVICDFGSAKKLTKDESNISYICSRGYRAPQLLFGSNQYNTKVDMWSAGCVLFQLANYKSLFKSQSSVQLLGDMIQLFGTPSSNDLTHMNNKIDPSKLQLPSKPRKQIGKALGNHHLGQLFDDLLQKIFQYNPKQRISPFEALKHNFFDQLRKQEVYKGIIKQYPQLNLFNFRASKQGPKISKLIPKWYNI